MQSLKKNSAIITSLLMTVLSYSPLSQAAEYGTGNNNFSMFDANGGHVGGTNLVKVTWDGTLNTDTATAVSNNMTISSAAPFMNAYWRAKAVTVYGPGTYTFYPCPEPIDANNIAADGSEDCSPGKTLTMTVGPDQIGAHMLFDWSDSVNIDVINVWNINQTWQFAPTTGTTSKISTHDLGNAAVSGSQCVTDGEVADWDTPQCVEFLATQWYLSAADADNDTHAGASMVDGPFAGFHAVFNIQPRMIADDSVSTEINTAVTTDVLQANDQSPETLSTGRFSISAFDSTTAEGGSVSDNGDGTFTYMPPVDFTGTDSFTYSIDDGVDHSESEIGAAGHYTATATVNITVHDAAVAAGNNPSSVVTATDVAEELANIGSLLVLPLMLLLLPLRRLS